jgi:pantoate--beta-alanine ligase
MTGAIETVRTVRDLRARVAAWRAVGETVALVPTMGAIHDGHLSLVKLAKAHCGRVVTSLFVNPLQFGPREDFQAYPRDEARDAQILATAGSDLLYAPDASEMYPPGFSTKVHVGDLTEDLCGASRPNPFDGVATVVAKLLLQCAPDIAIFGEKDYQQLLVIKRFVRDLNIPVEILGAPIVREALAGEDDSEAHEWAVYVREKNVDDETGPVEGGLRDRFRALVEEHGGWYDPHPSPRA